MNACCVCMCLCECIHVCVSVCRCLYVCVCVCVCMHKCVHMFVCVHLRVHAVKNFSWLCDNSMKYMQTRSKNRRLLSPCPGLELNTGSLLIIEEMKFCSWCSVHVTEEKELNLIIILLLHGKCHNEMGCKSSHKSSSSGSGVRDRQPTESQKCHLPKPL